jgi:DNA topoisomerase I
MVRPARGEPALFVSGTIYKTGYTPAHEGLPKPKITRPKKREKRSAAPRPFGHCGIPGEGQAPSAVIWGGAIRSNPAWATCATLLKSRLSVDVDDSYTPEYRVPNDKRQVVKDLKEAAAKAKEIYLATDPDREGEAIAWHVLESAEMEPERTKRVVFHEITKPAIEAAFSKPRGIDMERVNAQQARRILDRLVGYKLSPLLVAQGARPAVGRPGAVGGRAPDCGAGAGD